MIGLIFFLELTVAVLEFVFQDNIRECINDFFLANVKAYREDIDLQNLIDSLQKLVREAENESYAACCCWGCVMVYSGRENVRPEVT